MRGYRPFIIRVAEQAGNIYPITAEFEGASWSAVIPTDLPLLTKEEIQQALGWLERGFVDRDYAKHLGSRLFQTLFPDSIRGGFRTAYERVAPEGGLRLVLTLPQALADLPWELMYDEEGEHGFLARSVTAPLVRHFAGMPIPHLPPKAGPLRILIITASPPGYPPLSSEQEAKHIAASLARRGMSPRDTLRLLGRHLLGVRSLRGLAQRLHHMSRVEMDGISHATRQSLENRVVEAGSSGQGYHVVHFIGHGYTEQGGGYLLLEKEEGGADPVPADEFAEMIATPTVNLAVLNACQSGAVVNLFNGVAQATLRRGVPAVIGMQVPILDRAAVEFAQEFYGAWAAGEPIEGALAYARRLISQETPGAAADWGIPVLYMGPVEGLTLDLGAQAVRQPWPVKGLLWLVKGLNLARVVFLAVIALLGAVLLEFPVITRTMGTEVPVIRCIYPYPMGGDFNVAVTEFNVLDEHGSPVQSPDGQALANYLYKRLKSDFEDLHLKVDSYEIPYEIRSPAQTCLIKGRTQVERARAAHELANRLHADVLIYGTITYTGRDNLSRLNLEFDVNFKGFEQGEEIVGPHALGSALPLPRPFDTDGLLPDLAPSKRIKALSLITVGLSYYADDKPEQALAEFEQAKKAGGWSPNEYSQAVIYLLLGNANARLASMRKESKYLTQASEYYSAALSIDPSYARAKAGEATVLYLKALGDPTKSSFDSVDWAQLYEAEEAFRAGLTLENAPETADIETKVHFYLGQIYLVRGQRLKGEWFAQAESELNQVVAAYQAGNERIEDWAGHAYARLGLIAWLQRGDTTAAAAKIQEAIKRVSPYYQAEYHAWLAEVYVAAGQTDLAIQAYQDARDVAVLYGFEAEAQKYDEALSKLQAGE